MNTPRECHCCFLNIMVFSVSNLSHNININININISVSALDDLFFCVRKFAPQPFLRHYLKDRSATFSGEEKNKQTKNKPKRKKWHRENTWPTVYSLYPTTIDFQSTCQLTYKSNVFILVILRQIFLTGVCMSQKFKSSFETPSENLARDNFNETFPCYFSGSILCAVLHATTIRRRLV